MHVPEGFTVEQYTGAAAYMPVADLEKFMRIIGTLTAKIDAMSKRVAAMEGAGATSKEYTTAKQAREDCKNGIAEYFNQSAVRHNRGTGGPLRTLLMGRRGQ